MWDFSSEPAGATLTTEFGALANHRPAIKAEVQEYAERFRHLQIEALSTVLRAGGVDIAAFPPAAVVLVLQSVARFLVMEDTLGMSTGHAETLALVERLLARIEPGPPTPVSDVVVERTPGSRRPGRRSSC